MEDYVYFDIETTGLSIYKDRIIELGMIYNDKTTVLRFNPGIPISSGASKVHNIYDKDVIGCNSFHYYAPAIFKLFSKCKGVIGYNIRSFDIPMLQFELLRVSHEYILPDFQVIDVYELTQSLFKSLKLKDIYLTLSGKSLQDAHSALADIIATKELFEIIQDKFLKNPS